MQLSTIYHVRFGLLGLVSSFFFMMGVDQRAEADFVAGNLSANNGFSGTSGYNLTGPQTFTGQGYAIGVKFTVASPTSIAFDSVQLALAYRNGTNAIDVSLMADGNGGVPIGPALETIHLTNISAVPSLVTATSTAHSILSAGASYWLVAVYGAGNTSVGWMSNTSGQVGSAAYRPDSSSGQGSWVGGSNFTDPSFALFGSPVNAFGMSAVDAPPSAILVGIGCLGLASSHLFGRRRSVRDSITH